MAKAYRSSLEGATVVCLVPSRTDTRWWHEWAMRGNSFSWKAGDMLCWGTKLSAVSFSRGPLPTKNPTSPWQHDPVVLPINITTQMDRQKSYGPVAEISRKRKSNLYNLDNRTEIWSKKGLFCAWVRVCVAQRNPQRRER